MNINTSKWYFVYLLFMSKALNDGVSDIFFLDFWYYIFPNFKIINVF